MFDEYDRFSADMTLEEFRDFAKSVREDLERNRRRIEQIAAECHRIRARVRAQRERLQERRRLFKLVH